MQSTQNKKLAANLGELIPYCPLSGVVAQANRNDHDASEQDQENQIRVRWTGAWDRRRVSHRCRFTQSGSLARNRSRNRDISWRSFHTKSKMSRLALAAGWTICSSPFRSCAKRRPVFVTVIVHCQVVGHSFIAFVIGEDHKPYQALQVENCFTLA